MPTLETPIVEDLCRDILESRRAHLHGKRRAPEKRDYLYLSDLHVCTRHMYYSMVDGDKRAPFDDVVYARMESGEIWEQKVINQLTDMGFQWVQGQIRVELKNKDGQVIGRGMIDGKIRYKGKTIPVEIKNLDGNIFRRINYAEDLFKVEWTQKYMRQLLLYCYASNEEEGLFLITDRGGLWKVLPVFLGQNLDFVEATLRKMEDSYAAAKSGQVPDRIPYDRAICDRCAFNAICMPASSIPGGDAIDDPEIKALLERHEELKPVAKEYEHVHFEVSTLFREKPATIVGGRFIVTPSKRIKKGYNIKSLDKETLKSIETQTEFWTVEVKDASKPG